MLVDRPGYASLLRSALRTFPAVAVLGSRQCGKSTLVREFTKTLPASGRTTIFDLERPSDLVRLSTAPEEDLAAIHARPGLICIDEAHWSRNPSFYATRCSARPRLSPAPARNSRVSRSRYGVEARLRPSGHAA